MNQILSDEWQRIVASAACNACEQMLNSFNLAIWQHETPSAIFRPALSIDGDQWCALYGANLQDGVAGFGDSPELAMQDFNKNWTTKLGPKEQREQV